MTRRRCSSWRSRRRPGRPTGTWPPNCTSSPAARTMTGDPTVRTRPVRPTPPGPFGADGPFDLVRPEYGGDSLADLLPSALAVLGVPGATDPLGLTARTGRRTPDRRPADRRARLVPVAHRGPVRADPGRPGGPDRPAAHQRVSLDHPDQSGQSRHRGRAGRARGARLPGQRAGHRPGAHPHQLVRFGRRSAFAGPGSPALATVADPARTGRGGRGGGDRGEPPRVRRQRTDGGRQLRW